MCCSVVHTCSFASSGQCRRRTGEFLGDPSNSFCTSEVLTSRGNIINKCEWPKEATFKTIAIFNCSFSRNAKISLSPQHAKICSLCSFLLVNVLFLFAVHLCVLWVCIQLPLCVLSVLQLPKIPSPFNIFSLFLFYFFLWWFNLKLVEPKLHSKSEGKVSARKSLRKETLNGKENRFRISQSQKSVTKSEVPRFLCSFLPKSASVFFFFFNIYFHYHI